MRSSPICLTAILLCLAISATGGEGNLHIVSVGVDTEAWADDKLDRYARDALFVRQALTHSERLHDTVSSQLLSGKNATKKNVLAAFSRARKNASADDMTVIFFSSHGDLIKGTYNVLLYAPKEKGGWEGLSAPEFHRALKGIKGQLLILMDTCHAGALVKEAKLDGERTSFFLACSNTESSYGQWLDLNRPHGHFVAALCSGLKGHADKDRSGIVSVGELAAYMPGYIRSLEKKQTTTIHLTRIHKSLQLSETDTTVKKQIKETKPILNPFHDSDVPAVKDARLWKLLKSVRFPKKTDELRNDEWQTWVTAPNGKSLDGEWESRWKNRGGKKWTNGMAWFKEKKGRVYVLFKSQEESYLIDLARDKKGLLKGAYMGLRKSSGDEGPFVAKIIDNLRIDGYYEGGEWQFRRKRSTETKKK